MFYTVSKVFWAVGVPSTSLKLLIVTAIVLATLQKLKWAAWFASAGVVGLVLASATPAGYWLMVPLESRFPQWDGKTHPAPNGIILVGGANWDEEWAAFMKLSHRFSKARLLLSGVTHSASGDRLLRDKFARLGGNPTRLNFEDRSLTTAENALYSQKIIKPRKDERWVLITSAMHMPRTVGCFRRVGFQVDAYPIDFKTNRTASTPFNINLNQIGLFDTAVKEWTGLLAYRLAGKTGALFPAP